MTMFRLPSRPIALSLLFLGLFISACRPDQASIPSVAADSSDVPVMGDWIRIAMTADPDKLHPYNARTNNANVIKENIFNTLADFDPTTMKSTPTLVKGPADVSADGLRYTFEMRPEARWDNGDAITGYDFLFSLRCMRNPLTDNAFQRSYYDFIEDVSINANNDKRFTVTIKQPFFLAEISIADIYIISEAFFDSSQVMRKYSIQDLRDDAETYSKDPQLIAFAEKFNSARYGEDPAFIYGSGPYRLASWTHGDNITLERKKDWWGDQLRGQGYCFQGYADKLIFKVITDRGTLPLAAKNGEIDVTKDFLPDDFVAASTDTAGQLYQNFNFYTPLSYSTVLLGFNCRPGSNRKPLLTDLKVRQAIAHVVDIQNIIDNVYNGMATLQNGPISSLKPEEYDPNLKSFAFDIAAANQLLDEAGWKDSDADGIRDQIIQGRKTKLELDLLINASSATVLQMARIITDRALQAGIAFNLQSREFNAMNDQLKSHNFDVVISSFSGNHLPTDLEQQWDSQNWANGGSNYWGFGNAQSDSLIHQIRTTMTAAERKPLYQEFQKIWMEQLPAIILFSLQERIMIQKRFRNALPMNIKPGYKPYAFWVPKAAQRFK